MAEQTACADAATFAADPSPDWKPHAAPQPISSVVFLEHDPIAFQSPEWHAVGVAFHDDAMLDP
ncbi:MAG: hypothetical protein OXH69_04325 [Acidobacteria bacterium]|nr:hypothetical protein [Acidobacteriota bacterium]